MGGRKKLLILTIAVLVASVLTIAALLFLPPLLAILVGGLAVILLLSITAGPAKRRHDAVSKAQAEAAQRGDQAAFMGGKDHGAGW
jgi:hypothetical protein